MIKVGVNELDIQVDSSNIISSSNQNLIGFYDTDETNQKSFHQNMVINTIMI